MKQQKYSADRIAEYRFSYFFLFNDSNGRFLQDLCVVDATIFIFFSYSIKSGYRKKYGENSNG
jgi:hypothetical protein